jgi:hypothetical protein
MAGSSTAENISGEAGPYDDFRYQSTVNRAPFGNLKHPGTLFVIQRPGQLNFGFDLVEHAFGSFAILTIPGIDVGVTEAYRHAFERPLLAPAVKNDCHRSAGAQRGKEKIIGIRTCAGSTVRLRLIAAKMMGASNDLLRKAACHTTNYHPLLL